MSRPSLRERKKAKTRAAIQEHALRLFVEQGYAETTIEQIADAAEVSQSTLFRYFPTKEDTVLHDELDSPLIESLLAQPPELAPVAAIRAAIRDVYSRLTPEEMAAEQSRQKLAREVPEIRARTLEQYGNGAGKITKALAERLDRPADDLRIRVIAGAVIGVGLMAVLNDDVARLDDYYAELEAGFQVRRAAALAFAPATAAARPSAFPDDHSFIVNAARSNIAEVAAGRLALRKSDDAAVRAYARRMIADHTKANAELKRLARAWDTKVPTQPSPAQKREAAKLQSLSGSTFDGAYMRRQVVDHRKALALMLLEADNGRVGSLRAFASRTAPIVRMHLTMAKTTRASF